MSIVLKTGCSGAWTFIPKEFINIISSRFIVGKARVLKYQVVNIDSNGFKQVEITLDIVEIYEEYLDRFLRFEIDSDTTFVGGGFDYCLTITTQ